MLYRLRNYWGDPGYWRWVWRERMTTGAKGAIVTSVVVASATAGYVSAGWQDRAEERAAVTTQQVVTVARAMPANAAPEVTRPHAGAQSALVRMNVLSVRPANPQAARRFEVVARVALPSGAGSIRCAVWVGGERYRNIRLTWNSPIARCFFRIPDSTRGKPLQVRLSAALGTSEARMTLPFTVS